MRTTTPFIALLAATSLSWTALARGQETVRHAEAVGVREAVETATAEAQRARVDAEHQIAGARRELMRAQTELAQGPVPNPAGGGQGIGVATPGTGWIGNFARHIPGGAGRTLVIQYGGADLQTQANLEEDLTVMSRVFDKALAEQVGDKGRGRTAMGIDLVFGPGSNPIRSMYLEGYGALFMLNVGFPLVAPPAAAEETKEKTPADSTWEEARREVYGRGYGGRTPAGAADTYDADQVKRLKDSLLEALKSGTNIRNMKPDDAITICVFGGANSPVSPSRHLRTLPPSPDSTVEMELGSEDMMMNGALFRFGVARSPGTLLTIRVKKSDVDAFAKGKLNADEFRKKAGIAAYPGSAAGRAGTGQP